MDESAAEHWRRHSEALTRFRQALQSVLDTLAGDGVSREALDRALEGEPQGGELVPVVDSAAVDFNLLLAALTDFWAAYRNLPSPPGVGSWRKYLVLPHPLPRLQRGMLDQSFRALRARRSQIDEDLVRRLESCTFGDGNPNPGMESYVQRDLTAAPREQTPSSPKPN